MHPFCKLADPCTYVASPWDLSADAAARAHCVYFFKVQYDRTLKLGLDSAVGRGGDRAEAEDRAHRCREKFFRYLDEFAAEPQRCGRATILTIDAVRDGLLRQHGFEDAYLDLKNGENEKALPFLPEVCRQIDSLAGEAQLLAVIQGVFAGNIFDMGVQVTAARMLGKSLDFFATRRGITPRLWLVDDYDALAGRLLEGRVHRKAVVFADNAGSDFMLGITPMARWLAGRGTRVVLAVNEKPTLNDMTIGDVRAWWPRMLEVERSLASLRIECISTGTGEPLLDLSRVSPALNAAAADADLVILEGMGRALESNFDAALTCDALKVAMIKDTFVAERYAGQVFDVVCRFEPAKQ